MNWLSSVISELFSVTITNRALSANDDDFVYVNPNDNYSPNNFVKYGHWMSRNDDFELTIAFITNAAIMPGVLVALGILSFIIINFSFLFRCCCNCIKCLPDHKGVNYKRNRGRVLLSFYVVVFLCVAFNQLVFYGDHEFGKAVTTWQGSIDSVQVMVTDIMSDATDLVNYGSQLSDIAVSVGDDISGCPYLENYPGLNDTYNDAVQNIVDFQSIADDIVDQTDNVNKYFDDAQDYIDFYGQDKRFQFVCAIWLVLMLVVLLMLVCHFCHFKTGVQCSVFFMWLVFILFIILGAFWAINVTTLGDFCMNPVYTINKLVPNDVRDTTMYYTACQGESKVQQYINDAQQQIVNLNNDIESMKDDTADADTYCPGVTIEEDLTAMQAVLTQVEGTLASVSVTVGCETIQPILLDAINTGLCTELYNGMFLMWGAQLWTNFMLFIVILVASYVWQYYIYWNKTPEDVDSESESDGEEQEEEEEEDHFLHDTEQGNGSVHHPSAPSAPYDDGSPQGIAVVPVVHGQVVGQMDSAPAAAVKKGPKKMKQQKVSPKQDVHFLAPISVVEDEDHNTM